VDFFIIFKITLNIFRFVLGSEERSVFEKKQKYNDITNNNGQNKRNSIDSPPEPPYYMTVRVDRSRQQRKKSKFY